MKKFDMKSFIAGIIIGTTGITTVFAASGIKSAHVSNMNVTLNGASFSLSKPLLSVTMENEQEEHVYAPVNELLVNLGYGVNYNAENNTIDFIPQNRIPQVNVDESRSNGNAVFNIANYTDQRNIEIGRAHV